MFRRPKSFYLGRVTAAATHYQSLHARHGGTDPATRAAGHAYDMASRAALTRGDATLDEVAVASGLTDPPATLGVDDVDPDVVAALAHRTQVAS